MPHIVFPASLATKLWTHVPMINSLPSAPNLLFFLRNIGSVSCFVMLDPVNILLCWMVGCKPSSTEGTGLTYQGMMSRHSFGLWSSFVILLCRGPEKLQPHPRPHCPFQRLPSISTPPEPSSNTWLLLQTHSPPHSGSFECFQRSDSAASHPPSTDAFWPLMETSTGLRLPASFFATCSLQFPMVAILASKSQFQPWQGTFSQSLILIVRSSSALGLQLFFCT